MQELNRRRLCIRMFYSQDKQDEFLETHVFKGYRRGTFVDVGAWDGVCFNNSLFFEKERKWTGILIEPLKEHYEELVKNRPNCINLNTAISDTEGEADFLSITGPTGMLSGLVDTYDPRHLQRIENETREFNTTATKIKTPVRRLDSIFREHDIQRVHYLSIDTEGSELNVLKSINFESTYIDVIGFENNYPDKTRACMDFLMKKGYVQLHVKCYDVFMIREKSPFNPSQHP